MQHLVFVYGTLRKGESNHHYLQDSEFLGGCQSGQGKLPQEIGANAFERLSLEGRIL